MGYYSRAGKMLIPAHKTQLTEGLPVGTYTVGLDPNIGFYLSQIDDFNVSQKIYGKTTRWADRIIKTFMDRPFSTGVLLDGEKGSGKTLLAKLIAQRVAEDHNISTLIINAPLYGDGFNSFIQSIDEPCVIIFDEFEKVYSQQEEQNQVLTLLDGVYPSKKLFILTSNDKHRVNSAMQNRPGRIYYFIEYKGLDSAFIEEYCQDNLVNKNNIGSITRVAGLFDQFNFDMLKALVEEMNRYGETAVEAIDLLNAKPFLGRDYTMYTVSCIRNGQPVPPNYLYPREMQGNPLSRNEQEITVTFNSPVTSDIEDAIDNEYDEEFEIENADGTKVQLARRSLKIPNSALENADTINGAYTYNFVDSETGDSYIIALTKKVYETYSWQGAF